MCKGHQTLRKGMCMHVWILVCMCVRKGVGFRILTLTCVVTCCSKHKCERTVVQNINEYVVHINVKLRHCTHWG